MGAEEAMAVGTYGGQLSPARCLFALVIREGACQPLGDGVFVFPSRGSERAKGTVRRSYLCQLRDRI